MNYPTLSVQPDVSGFKQEALNKTLRTETESGVVLTRKQFTKTRKKWNFNYTTLSNTDKGLIENFEISVGYGADTFTWICPTTSVSHTVRFKTPVQYNYASNLNNEWDVAIELEEA